MNNYPPKEEQARVQAYALNNELLEGEHYNAFRSKLPEFIRDNDAVKYLAVNFCGLISKLSADMLFEEFPKITMPDGKNEWLELVFRGNNLKTQFYESAVEGSARGDIVYRIRAKEGRLVIEDINPAIWFPIYNENNVRAEAKEHILAWEVGLGGDRKGVYMERHLKGFIITELWSLGKDNKLEAKQDLKAYYPEIEEQVETKIDDFLIVHIPNPKTNSSFFGVSDYKDILPLVYAINNRLTRTDSILDKHGDPILAVPKGVLDENGQVARRSFGVVEVDTGQNGGEMPQYIVWDAKLDSAFTEIDTLVEFVLMLSESSRTALGIDKEGVGVESGKALKYKLLRTIAKKHRKELYFDAGIKKILYIAQQFAKANGLVTMDNMKLTTEPQHINIEWQDGVIMDLVDQLDIEERRLSAGLTTKVDSIARLDGISVAEAQTKKQEIDKEKQENAPKFSALPFVANSNTN